MRDNIFAFKSLKWTRLKESRVFFAPEYRHQKPNPFQEAEVAAKVEDVCRDGGSIVAVVSSTPLPATHIINEDRDMETLLGGGMLKHSDVDLGLEEAYKMGIYLPIKKTIIEKHKHQRTLEVGDKLWLSPRIEPDFATYSRSNMAPGKTLLGH